VEGSTPSKTKRKLHIEEEAVMQKHRPPPLQRKFRGLDGVPLGTSSHKEGVVAVVEE
jgi:hypothetical protein